MLKRMTLECVLRNSFRDLTKLMSSQVSSPYVQQAGEVLTPAGIG